ncbi:MAG: cell division protein FtsQ/DivIB [Suilimivivens sp.]
MAEKKIKKKKQVKKTNIRPVRVVEKKEKPKREIPVKKVILTAAIVLAVFTALFSGYYYITTNYTVTTVYVEGNVHYTNEEIMGMVMEGRYGRNSLFLSLKYKDKSIEDIPFIEKMDVSVLDPHTVKIEVYEKALAGYVEYLDRYMYFDKDGIVVESSTEKTKGIPMVTGLLFDHVVLYQVLPVEDEEIFSEILSITKLVNKYDLSVDRIYFGMDGTLTLYFEEVKAAFGTGENLEEKVMQLQYILPELEGKSGTLRMENYTEESKTITFEPD